MEGLKRQIKYQLMDSKKAFIIFWGVIIAVNILFYWLNSISDVSTSFGVGQITTNVEFNGQATSTRYLNVAGSNIIAILIFILVYNIVMYYESFPTAIGFSSTRKNFYLGAVAHNALLCLSMAITEGILLKLDRYIIIALGEKPLDKFLMIDLKSVGILYSIAVLFLIFIFACSIFNLLGVVLYKWGFKFWIVMLIGFTVLGNIRFQKPIQIFDNLIGFLMRFDGLWSFAAKFILTSVVLYTVSWLLIKRRAVRSGR